MGVEDRAIPLFEREYKNLSFAQLLNYAASIQFSVFSQVRTKLSMSMNWCNQNNLAVENLVSIEIH